MDHADKLLPDSELLSDYSLHYTRISHKPYLAYLCIGELASIAPRLRPSHAFGTREMEHVPRAVNQLQVLNTIIRLDSVLMIDLGFQGNTPFEVAPHYTMNRAGVMPHEGDLKIAGSAEIPELARLSLTRSKVTHAPNLPITVFQFTRHEGLIRDLKSTQTFGSRS